VTTSQTAPAYITGSDIKAAMQDGNWGETYDAILSVLARRASRAFDKYCKVPPGYFQVTSDSVRYFDGPYSKRRHDEGRSEYNMLFFGLGVGGPHLDIDELAQTPTLVEVDDVGNATYTTVDPADYTPYPYNAPDKAEPYRRLDILIYRSNRIGWPVWRKSIRITGRWGWSVLCPEDVKELIVIQAARWFKRGQQGFADTGAIVELGQLRYTQGLDPDIRELARGWRRITL
jgi:hypothetical protein